MIRFGRCRIDVAARTLHRAGAPVDVQARVFDLLVHLIYHRHRVVPTEELLDTVWRDVTVMPNSVARAVHKARAAIGDDGQEQRSIATMRGRGFRFVGRLLGDEGEPSELSKPTFVGRRHELECLRHALDSAEQGRGRLVFLTGEPGIGKTHTANEFTVRARGAGARICFARCAEGVGASPYWTWRQIGRDLASEQPHVTTPGAPLAPELAADDMPLRLFESVVVALERAARERTLVIALDDLHLADPSSLAVLRLLARSLAELPILVVGTLRDAALEADPTRRALLAGAERHAGGQTLELRGLDAEEVGLLAEKRVGRALDPPTVSALHRRSGGNPFFLGELLQIAERRGIDAIASDAPERTTLPSTVRAALTLQLDGLAPRDRRVLTRAAGLGEPFEIALLAELCECAPEQILENLAAAAARHIVESLEGRPTAYRFVHGLLREALYAELDPVERARLHRRAGEVLERGPDPDPAELAFHWFEAIAVGGAGRAVHHACEAARMCRADGAFEREARHLEQALLAMELLTHEAPRRRCSILVEAGATLARSDPPRGESILVRALELARSLDEREQRSLLLSIASAASNLRFVGPQLAGAIGEALRALDGDEISTGAALWAAAGRGCLRGDPDAERRVLRAVEIGRASGDPRVLGSALCAWHWVSWRPDNRRLRREATREIERLGAAAGSSTLLEGRYLRALDALEGSDRPQLLAALEDLRRGALDAEQALPRWRWLACRSMLALLEGRFAAAERLRDEALELGRRSGIHDFDVWTAHDAQRVRCAYLRGDPAAVGESRRRRAEQAPEDARAQLALASWLVEVGDLAAARACLDACSPAELLAGRPDAIRTHRLARVCGALGDPMLCEGLRELLLPWRGANLVDASICCSFGPAARYLALVCGALGDWSLAEECFEEATVLCERLGASAELIGVRADFARMLAARGRSRDRAAALAQLDLARAAAARLRVPAVRRRLDRADGDLRAI